MIGRISILILALVVSLITGWTSLATRMNGEAYDWMFRIQPPPRTEPSSVVLAIDEQTLAQTGGMLNIRRTIAQALKTIEAAKPRAVAVDVILADSHSEDQDAELEGAFRNTRHLVLAADMIPDQHRWEYPLPRFRQHAESVGHIHAAPDPVSRILPLEHAGGRDRRWAMALEAFRDNRSLTETPTELTVGNTTIPVTRDSARALYIQYRPGIPHISMANAAADVGQFRSKVVFVGLTAQTAARDRLMTPLGQMMSGVEIHAQAYETLTGGRFLQPVGDSTLLLFCIAITIAAGLIFAFLTGAPAYTLGAIVIVLAMAAPHIAFASDIIIPYLTPVITAWFTVATAASWQHFVVRRQLRKSESDKARYQQAIHFVTHEMRSPLTAIQGSSELMGRYNLNDDKRKQMAQMINTESKRLARMVQTFLDVERLTDGQMEIRTEPIDLAELTLTCIERARPLAERKQIEIAVGAVEPTPRTGDRELMEYAVYNLLTNAVKYSPAETTVTVTVQQGRIAVQDQGIGLDAKEIKSVFKKFYRTKKAEASGEVGTGIGLSIVQQIVEHHRGQIAVTSEPGKGSCFTIVL